MTVRLQLEPWARLPDLTRPSPPSRRERSLLAWAVPYWVAALAFAYAAHADWVPVRSWLEALATSRSSGATVSAVSPQPPGQPSPVLSDAARRRSAMGVFTAQDDERDRLSVATDGDWESVPLEPATEGDGAPAERASDDGAEVERSAESTVEPVRADRDAGKRRKSTASGEQRVAARAPAVREPTAEAARAEPRSRSRLEALGAAVDEALGVSSARGRPAAIGSDEPEQPSSAPSRRRRARGGKVQSCEAAIASYKEEWTIGQGSSGPPDLTAEQYGAVLNSSSYFRHCGVPGRMGVKICAAVQNGQAIGVTVTTSPRSSKISRCIAAAVRGLSFPHHPRMDVTTTVFKPAR